MKITLLRFFFTFTLIATGLKLTAATVTWDGGGDGTNWTDPLNWDTDTVPTASDDVVITSATVVLSSDATVQRVLADGSSVFTINAGVTLTITGFAGNDEGLEIQTSANVTNNGTIDISSILGGNGADGLYSKGTCTNNGTITIDGIGQHGLYVVAGLFTNASTGIITVTNVSVLSTDSGGNPDGDGVYVDDANSGTLFGNLTNEGAITVTMTTGDDGIYVNDNTTLNNTGTITVSGTGTTDNGMRVDDGGVFNNNAGGTLTINATIDDQLFLDNDGAVNNTGTINLNNSLDIGLYHTDDAVFTNNIAGIVNINNTSNYAIQIDANSGAATISNSGTITVTGGSNDGLRMQEAGVFTNNAGGVLTLNTSGDEAIQLDNPSTLNNSGTITITGAGGNTAPGDNGIELAGGTLNNFAMLTITNSFDKGILLNSGILNNDGTLEISNTGEEGMDMVGGTFNNNTGATFQAANCTDDGLEVNTAVVNNDGAINIYDSGSDDIETFTGFAFNNTSNATFAPGNPIGQMEIRSDFDMGAATITFDISGTTAVTEFDQIENFLVPTVLTIAGATADLNWGSYIPSVGDTFKIVDGSGLVTGTFSAVTTSNSDIVTTINYSADEVEVEVIEVLSIDNVSVVDFSIYPNPAKTEINIQSSNQTQIDNVELYNILGRRVLVTGTLVDNKVNVANIASGIYLMKIKSGNNSVTKKIIIE